MGALPQPNPEPVRVVFTDDPEAPPICYSPNPAEFTVNEVKWWPLPRAEKEWLLAHEYGHHDTGAVYFWTDDLSHEIDLLRVERKAERAGLVRLIPDARVRAAYRDGCHELYEFAEFWGVDEQTAWERLKVYSPLVYGR